jgi:4-amino-4-deoxy-L-arabinose transferase-like glycosyltransferase
MTKGIIGPLLVGAPPVLALVLMRDWRVLRSIVPRALLLCGVPVAATATAWILELARECGWEVVQESVINNTLGRTLGDAGSEFGTYGHSKPFWYYLHAFPVGMLPWSLAIPALWTSRILDRGTRPARARFVAALVVAGILVLSLPAGKRTLYFMPLLPAAAALFGVWVSRIGSRSGSRLDRGTLTLLIGLFATACSAAAVLLGWIAVRGAPVAKFAPIEESSVLPGAAVLAAIGAVVAVVLGRRAWAGCTPAVVRSALALGLLATALAGAVGRRMLDPMHEMRTGATQAAALVTSSERIVGVSLGETEEAILSFYSGRPVTNLRRPEQLAPLLDEGAIKEFVVEDVKRTTVLRRALDQRYDTLGRVEISEGDFVIVYGVRPGQDD